MNFIELRSEVTNTQLTNMVICLIKGRLQDREAIEYEEGDPLHS